MRNQIQARDWPVWRQPITTQNKLLQLVQSKKQKFEIQSDFLHYKKFHVVWPIFSARQVKILTRIFATRYF